MYYKDIETDAKRAKEHNENQKANAAERLKNLAKRKSKKND